MSKYILKKLTKNMCFCRMRSILFTPHKIGHVNIKNRFIRSATCENLSQKNGLPLPKLFSMMKQLADGEVGLIIPGYVYPSNDSISWGGQVGMTSQLHSDIWKPTIEYIHSRHSRIFFQVCHCGSRTSPELIGGKNLKSVSGLIKGTEILTNAEIEDIIANFTNCAKLIQSSGADGIQLHAAHGYLLSEFLSPFYNRREDKWGKDKLRIIKEIVKEIRKSTNLAISLKMNGHDCIDGGVTPKICASYINELLQNDENINLENSRIDMFEISCGFSNLMTTIRSDVDLKRIYKGMSEDNKKYISSVLNQADQKYPYFEGYNAKFADEIRKLAPKATLAVVGGNRDFNKMQKLIIDNTVDFVSMSRPFIRQPHLLRTYQDALTTKSDCTSCGECIIKPTDKSLACTFTHE
ncbi:oxidoreductase, FAD/FMN-binding family protein [Tritrichomonas foetus]|uniref:Oxidoreductase, FAD/FMN-binding family protein n=1 Tax=Tritrichomonas foetus TaxID=1144522 RepID=A0A1J4J6H1_9EUKA|nr:oxidoreductase, FAD/FMN-binding family protein [Tritrichomonas foetus]|eukprot:OHS93767.1 oxidoreductase, FAD/FMN-binding family protein [Tritrichomonas foetus]